MSQGAEEVKNNIWMVIVQKLFQWTWNGISPLVEGIGLIYSKWVIGPFAGIYLIDQITKFPSWITYKVSAEVEKIESSLYMKWSKQDQNVKKYLSGEYTVGHETCSADDPEVSNDVDEYNVNFVTFLSYIVHNHLPDSFIPYVRDLSESYFGKGVGFYGKLERAEKQSENNNYVPILKFVKSGCEYSNFMVQLIRDIALLMDSKVGLGDDFLGRFKSCPDIKNLDEFESYMTVMTKLSAMTINQDYEQTVEVLHYLESLISNQQEEKFTELNTEIKFQKLRCMFHYKGGSYQPAAHYQKIAVETNELLSASNSTNLRHWEIQRLHDTALRKKYFIECIDARKCNEDYITKKHEVILSNFNYTIGNLTELRNENNEPEVDHDINIVKENVIKTFIDRAEILKDAKYLEKAFKMAKEYFEFGDIALHVSEELNIISTLARIVYVEAKLGENTFSDPIYNWVSSYLNEHTQILPNNASSSLEMAKNLYSQVNTINSLCYPSTLLSYKTKYYLEQLDSLSQSNESRVAVTGDSIEVTD
ncbi:MAG: hypothetical protein RLN62_01465 [Rickettsiales bacterium]